MTTPHAPSQELEERCALVQRIRIEHRDRAWQDSQRAAAQKEAEEEEEERNGGSEEGDTAPGRARGPAGRGSLRLEYVS